MTLNELIILNCNMLEKHTITLFLNDQKGKIETTIKGLLYDDLFKAYLYNDNPNINENNYYCYYNRDELLNSKIRYFTRNSYNERKKNSFNLWHVGIEL